VSLSGKMRSRDQLPAAAAAATTAIRGTSTPTPSSHTPSSAAESGSSGSSEKQETTKEETMTMTTTTTRATDTHYPRSMSRVSCPPWPLGVTTLLISITLHHVYARKRSWKVRLVVLRVKYSHNGNSWKDVYGVLLDSHRTKTQHTRVMR